MGIKKKFMMWGNTFFAAKVNDMKMKEHGCSIKCPICKSWSHSLPEDKQGSITNDIERVEWDYEVLTAPSGMYFYTCGNCKSVTRWDSGLAPFPVMDSLISLGDTLVMVLKNTPEVINHLTKMDEKTFNTDDKSPVKKVVPMDEFETRPAYSRTHQVPKRNASRMDHSSRNIDMYRHESIHQRAGDARSFDEDYSKKNHQPHDIGRTHARETSEPNRIHNDEPSYSSRGGYDASCSSHSSDSSSSSSSSDSSSGGCDD